MAGVNPVDIKVNENFFPLTDISGKKYIIGTDCLLE